MAAFSPLTIAHKTLEWGARTYVMGILNITPDSFSGDGLIPASPQSQQMVVDRAVEQAQRFVSAGADILDIGGESTRPGASPITVQEELDRVIPVIQAISNQMDILISVDTYHAVVAEAALEAGANIVNDVWSLQVDPDMAGVVARYSAPVVLMHNHSSWAHTEVREKLGGRYVGKPFVDMILDIQNELKQSLAIAHAAGIQDENIILDPGVGFGMTVSENLELIDRLAEIRSLGYPVLLGPSRKSFIGYTLDLPPDQRLEGTAAAVAVGIARGVDIVRVHDVEFMVRVARMTDAIVRRTGK
ncbi:MAG TPA: dihydropteroate synthase [Anaerolineales bacterium]|nr:dihydropteroate synthase [Anaerolineales bacterium]